MTRQPTLADKHSRREEILFGVKAALLSLRRALKNLLHPTKRFATASARQGTELVRSESELWNAGDNAHNWLLTAGKVQNLRTAIKYLDGLEIPAGQTFSFWKQIGNPNTNRSFVVGRELREGCIIPTKAGGLCQLSNALYDAALKAGFEIIERHKHTQVIPGSLAEQGRDATVKWNYIDLRFRSKHRFTISAQLTDTQLIVRFIAVGNGLEITLPQNNIPQQAPAKLNDCYTCGNMACFKHPGQTPAMDTNGITAFILDEYWPEFDAYAKNIANPNDAFIVPAVNNRWMGKHRQGWTLNTTNVKTGGLAAIRREVLLRLKIKRGENIFSSQLQTDRQYAQSLIKRIPVQAKHLIISQNLLPFMWQSGALGGRTFDVLLTRLPIELLHKRLDAAHAKFSNSKTLNDFRAGQLLIDLENSALTKARHVVTPHAVLAEIFGNKVIRLDWALPAPPKTKPIAGTRILFPASALARKGAYEMRHLAQELNLELVLTGRATEEAGFWSDVKVTQATGDLFDGIQLLVYPAYIEHRPKLLLKAIAAGLPVIATEACGIAAQPGITIIPTGDYQALKEAAMLALQISQEAVSI